MLSEATSDAITLSDLYLSRYPYCQGASANTLKGVVLKALSTSANQKLLVPGAEASPELKKDVG